MTTYTNPFSGQTIYPTTVSYESITLSANTILQWPVNGNTNTPVSSIIDVTATAGSLLLELPPAAQVSTGQSVLVRNIGSNTFTVTDNSGNTIVAIASGLAYYIWLTDNSTTNGVWTQVQFGASTSTANAASLAGYGLEAISTTLNSVTPISYISSTENIPTSAMAGLQVWAGGVGTLTLPQASSVGSNWYTTFKNNGTGILTVQAQGSDLIDQSGTNNVQIQIGESFTAVSDGGVYGWDTFGYGQAVQFAFTQLLLNITGGTYTLSAAQAAYILQNYSGTLTSNQIIIIPPTVQFYVITNSTTGSYTFTISTGIGGGSTVSIPQGNTVAVVCDGTNVVPVTAINNSLAQITLSQGSTTSPAINFIGSLTSGFYSPGAGQVGVTINGANAATFSSTGLTVVNGISGGTF